MTETRRVTITNVMQALHDKGGDSIKERHLRKLLGVEEPGREDDLLAAVWGAEELDLVTVDEEAWGGWEVHLTADGKAWAPGDELTEIVYAYFVDGEMALGTLADWAKLWETSYYASIDLSPDLRTGRRFSPGYTVRVDRLGLTENDYIKYCISAAGEQLYTTVDGRA